MPLSQEYESIVGFATTLVALAGVAVMVRGIGGAMFHHSIPPEDLDRIAKKYGYWAARRAEAMVPHMDVEACEREAKRLYEVIKYRR
ncbi:unnamed protein product [marine sediment metagenome]|uniref:Uncharacterized protein n=1 Tax=marine sediment metagenome TaxID=412755 RepID=X1VKZ1_9ZZZZ